MFTMVWLTLASITLQASAGSAVFESDPEGARQALQAIRLAGASALSDLRATLGLLRHEEGSSADAGFDAELVERLAEVLRAEGIQVSVHQGRHPRPLTGETGTSAQRILQEALTNVLRHSGAREVEIGLDYIGDEVVLIVTDDGKGPVKGSGLLVAKWAGANIYMVIGLAILGFASLIAGAAFFGVHPLEFESGESMSAGGSVLRMFLTYAYVFTGMLSVVSLAVLLSTLTDSSLTAAAGALVLVIVMLVLQGISVFDFLKPYLITNYLDAWSNFFRTPMDWEPIWKGLVTFGVWSAGTLGLSLWRFARKDIVS